MASGNNKNNNNVNRRSSRICVNDTTKDSKKSIINEIDFEIGVRVYMDEHSTLSYDQSQLAFKKLSESNKIAYISKIPIQNINRRKKQLIVLKSEDCNKKKKSLTSLSKQECKSVIPSKICMEVQRLIGLPASYIFQPVCYICEKFSLENPAENCSNSKCHRYFHKYCVERKCDINQNKNGHCLECMKDTFTCAFCRSKFIGDNKRYMCQMDSCLRAYHESCLNSLKYPYMSIDEDTATVKICPAHFCVTCVREDAPFQKCFNKKLIECARCSNSYHLYDLCMVAGTVELSLSHVVCPRHFLFSLTKENRYATINVNNCLVCLKTGVNVRCSFCPRSFHSSCLDSSMSDKSGSSQYICKDCRLIRNPRIASVQFVKLSQFRWWPCEIVHTRNGPMNLVKMGWSDGTFLVRFLGTNEYQWVSQNRCLSYNMAERFSMTKLPTGSSKTDKNFKEGLKEAEIIHKVYVNILKKFVPLNSQTASEMTDLELDFFINYEEDVDQSPKFENLKANLLIAPAKYSTFVTPKCQCPTSECSPPTCINYQNKVQCDKSTCPAADKCKNQIFNPIDKNAIGVFKTPDRGYGLMVLVQLQKDTFISEYIGEIINEKEANTRIDRAIDDNIKDFYMLQLDAKLIIDAGPKGTLTRFINHSCNANCYAEKWMVNGLPKLGIFSRKDIPINEELTINYHESGAILHEDRFCLCCSAECCGYLFSSKNSVHSSPTGKQRLNRSESSIESPLKPPIVLQESHVIISDVMKTSEVSTPVPPSPSSSAIELSPKPEIAEESADVASCSEPDLDKQSEYDDQMDAATVDVDANHDQEPQKPPQEDDQESQQLDSQRVEPIVIQNLSTPNKARVVTKQEQALNTADKNTEICVSQDGDSSLDKSTTSSNYDNDSASSKITQEIQYDDSTVQSSKTGESFCFRCFDGGELIVCDKRECPKTYHKRCLGLKKAPQGTWYCPWHFCDVCGERSAVLCGLCPRSYCQLHATPRNIRNQGNKFLSYCNIHPDKLVSQLLQSLNLE